MALSTAHELLVFLVVAGCAGPVADPVAVGTSQQAATACPQGETIRGMDVSSYEASIDWGAAREAGIQFAFIRASDGRQYVDPKFASHWEGAKTAGVIRGAYQFFRPEQDPIAQADLLLQAIGSLEAGDLPPVIDVEVSGGRSRAQVAAAIRAWVDHVTAAIGRPPIVYTGQYAWADLTGSADVTTSPLWLAQYTTAACPYLPSPWTQWSFWQTTDSGSVAGVPGSGLDLDVFNGSRADLLAFSAAGPCGDGTCSGDETADSCPGDCPPCGTIGEQGGEIDDGDACFHTGARSDLLHPVTGTGEQGDLLWTSASDTAEAMYAQWDLNFAAAGRYRVEVFTAHGYATSTRAIYVIDAGGTVTTSTLDQSAADGWQALGEVDFAAGGGQSIHLGSNTGESPSASAQLVFDGVRLVRVDDGAGGGDDQGATASGCATTGRAGLPVAVAALFVRRRRRGRSLAG
jgi:lysozyme